MACLRISICGWNSSLCNYDIILCSGCFHFIPLNTIGQTKSSLLSLSNLKFRYIHIYPCDCRSGIILTYIHLKRLVLMAGKPYHRMRCRAQQLIGALLCLNHIYSNYICRVQLGLQCIWVLCFLWKKSYTATAWDFWNAPCRRCEVQIDRHCLHLLDVENWFVWRMVGTNDRWLWVLACHIVPEL